MFRLINNLKKHIQKPFNKKLLIVPSVAIILAKYHPYSVSLLPQTNQNSFSTSNKNQQEFSFKMDKSELKKRLTPLQYRVTQEADTEHPFTGIYDKHFEKGDYICIVCGETLFKSDSKFNSGCGWPAFSLGEEGKIKENVDNSHGMVRTEVVCKKCGAHLGHVFNDGPKPRGIRYCINSASLDFKKSN